MLLSTGLCRVPIFMLTSSYSPVLWRSEEVTLGDGDGGKAQDTYYDQVNHTGLRGAVKGVVKPRHKTTHDQECDARVVQPKQYKTGKTSKIHSWSLSNSLLLYKIYFTLFFIYIVTKIRDLHTSIFQERRDNSTKVIRGGASMQPVNMRPIPIPSFFHV